MLFFAGLIDVKRLITLTQCSIKNKTKKEYVQMETPVRSLFKAISWRIVATLTTISLVVLFSRDLTLGTIVGITEFLLKTLVYYVHERVWNLTDFGRRRK